MSTILRALRKLEEEKATDADVALQQSVVAPTRAPKPRRGWWMFVAAFLAAGVGAGVAWQFAPGGGSSVAQVDSSVRAPDPIAVAARRERSLSPPVAAAGSERVERKGVVPPTDLVRARAPDGVEPAAASVEAAFEHQIVSHPPVPEISSEVVVVEREERPSLLAEELPEPRPAEPAPVRVVRPVAKPLQRAPAPIARVQEAPPVPKPALPARERVTRSAPNSGAVHAPKADPLKPPAPTQVAAIEAPQPEPPVAKTVVEVQPGAVRSAAKPPVASPVPGIPELMVKRTIWHPSPGRRRALVEIAGNSEALNLSEGDRVGELVLTQIKPSGVVFEFQGIELSRRVGSSK